MITDLIYRCPRCGRFDWFDRGACRHCGVTVSLPSREALTVDGETAPIAYWYDKVLDFPMPEPIDGVLRRSGRVVRFEERCEGAYRGFGGIFATRCDRRVADEGHLELCPEAVRFRGAREDLRVDLDEVTALTIESDTLIMVARGSGVHFFRFDEESGKMWEDCIKQALEVHCAPKRVLEFYPKIRFVDHQWRAPRRFAGYRSFPIRREAFFRRESSIAYRVIRWTIRQLVSGFFSVQVRGLDKIPSAGPAVVVANHGSILDGILLNMFPKRDICFMAKNAPFQNALLRWFLRHSGSFPVFRYRVDPQVIRNALRVIDRGDVLGLFPEGERNWDGRMLPFKTGSMRLILALGVPIVPIGISGSYALMPRWTSRLKRVPIRVQVGEPFRLDQIPLPQQTMHDVARTAARLQREIEALF